MSQDAIIAIIARLDLLERKAHHLPDPNVRIPGDMEGLGEVLFGACAIGFAVGSTIWIVTTIQHYFQK